MYKTQILKHIHIHIHWQFDVKIDFFAVDCHEEITIAGKEFTSPNHPGDYPSNANCTQVIRFKEGQIITLEFLEFNLFNISR